MLSKIVVISAGALALTGAAFAQTPVPPSPHTAADPFTFMSDKELEEIAIKPGMSGPVLGMLSDHENYYVEVVGRTVSGEPEFHTLWIK